MISNRQTVVLDPEPRSLAGPAAPPPDPQGRIAAEPPMRPFAKDEYEKAKAGGRPKVDFGLVDYLGYAIFAGTLPGVYLGGFLNAVLTSPGFEPSATVMEVCSALGLAFGLILGAGKHLEAKDRAARGAANSTGSGSGSASASSEER